MYDFTLTRPTTIADAVSALQGEDAQPIAGGQTLLPTMKARLAQAETFVSLTGISEMRGISAADGVLTLGGGATHATVAREAAASYPALASLAGRIGDPAVRTRGTVGGSIANNDPSACYPAGALGSGATITATGPNGSREIAADDYFQGMFATALEEGEIITKVAFPIPEKAAYEKMLQPASRFPLVAVFVAKYADGVRVAITGASTDGVFRWSEAEAALSGDFSPAAIEGLTPPSNDMISDLHGTPEYRAHLCKVLTARAVRSAQ
ncbi:FAD binding domain-containing protein [Jannaschia seohaensis]|uniref:Carbon-monoxide dehydrogenase medium subunit n=1 Tax=Jannaschia seohaensis TaxID=475081 RepID=A0A2Y9AVR9_9RHOB|nr:xanthine dehydrogenase family protein subunit M [Jannaschia seohaensis]PWJ18102.1 carbon-monoxide dehydrogenase medium subunit [Jannaschia seohaensis]SSA46627.1 carbon-monoxide dehydrogenase medium subunit [Jannaschia seohaensis]